MNARDLAIILRQYDGDMPVVTHSDYLKWNEIETVNQLTLANDDNEEVQVICLSVRKRPIVNSEMREIGV